MTASLPHPLRPKELRHILVVDDESRIRQVVEYALTQQGFRVTLAANGRSALSLIDSAQFDLVVLDIMLPDFDGLDLCRELRARTGVPILFLSAKAEEFDRVLGLEVGGDDYLTKPFSPRELVARVKAVLRRGQAPPTQPSAELRAGRLVVDLERREVIAGGQSLYLTATEFVLLAALVERPGVVFTRDQLVERVHSFDTHVTSRTIDSHIRRIRHKFRASGLSPVATVHGVGYKLDEAGL